jgi:hypothetical protein
MFMETLFPHDRKGKVIIFLVLLSGLTYWFFSCWHHPHDPLSVAALYRGSDDMSYYPVVKALSECTIGESAVYEYAGSGVRSCPFLPLLVHAGLFRFFGPAAFVIGEVLFTILYYLLAVTVLRACGISQSLSRLVSFCLTAGMLNFTITVPSPFDHSNTTLFFDFWDRRFPRPLISGSLLLVPILLLMKLCSPTDTLISKSFWILFGIAAAGLLQADPYSSIVFFLGAGMAFVFLLFTARQQRSGILRGMMLCIPAGVLTSLPLFIQRLLEHPDLPRRYGVFPVDRNFFLFAFQNTGVIALVIMLAICLEILKRGMPGSVTPAQVRYSQLLSLLCVAACLALPISGLVLGKTIQPYHFALVSITVASYGVLIHALLLLQIAFTRFQASLGETGRCSVQRFMRALSIVIVIAALLFTMQSTSSAARKSTHIRADFPEWEVLQDYRRHFTALIGELQHKRYAACKVAGLFDHQMAMWWLTFGGGKLFLVEPYSSTVSDREVESRFFSFCRLLGMTPDSFISFIKKPSILSFWFGINKYQASRLHTFSPMEDYSPENQKKILSTPGVESWQSTWNVILPLSEEKRLRYEYEREPVHSRHLDLIILTRSEIDSGFSPQLEDFTLGFENPVFQVWVRRSLLNK